MEKKLIVAGSRSFRSYDLIKLHLDEYRLTEKDYIISGTASGADTLGEEYAQKNGIQIIRMPANWNEYGKAAGYKRNYQMALEATEAIVFWDGRSPGTKHMIDIMFSLKKPIRIIIYK